MWSGTRIAAGSLLPDTSTDKGQAVGSRVDRIFTLAVWPDRHHFHGCPNEKQKVREHSLSSALTSLLQAQ